MSYENPARTNSSPLAAFGEFGNGPMVFPPAAQPRDRFAPNPVYLTKGAIGL